mgnify:CR=1 FL=1
MTANVTTTYLEMKNKANFQPKSGFEEMLNMIEIENTAFLNFILFTGVGLPWSWYSRMKWSEGDWQKYLDNDNSRLFLGMKGKEIIGYCELEYQENDQVEIKFFGLLPDYYGTGLGGMLLSHAIKIAWEESTKRLWVHTCSKDSEAALKNYLSRGFEIYKEETLPEKIPSENELLGHISNFFKWYRNKYVPK